MGKKETAREGFSKRLKELRTELFGTRGQTKMAAALGVSPTTYNPYELRGSFPLYPTMARFCLQYRVNPVWLLEGRGSKFLNGGERPMVVAEAEATYGSKAVEIPVFESVGAGDPREINALEPAKHLLLDPALTTPGMVALRVRGDSMRPEIPDGSVVGVDARRRTPQDLQHRKVFVLWIKDAGMVVRRLHIYGKDLSFFPDNPTEENRPYIYKRKGHEDLIIQGRVEWVLHELNS